MAHSGAGAVRQHERPTRTGRPQPQCGYVADIWHRKFQLTLLLRVLSPMRDDNMGFGAMSRPDFSAGFVLQGISAFVPRGPNWIIKRSRAHFHALRVS